MFGDRHEIRLMLETMSPIHIGSGEATELALRPGANDTALVATIVRDVNRLPYLPATSIKGALLSLAQRHLPKDDGLVPLFGAPKSGEKDKSSGVMGRLLTRGGRVVGALPDISPAPFADAADRMASFIAARTAIDHEKGVADDHKLFHQEMAIPGLCFELAMTFACFGGKDEQDNALDLLRRLLGIVARDGLMLGRSQADGQGLLRVRGQVTITAYILSGTGNLEPGQPEIVKTAAASTNGDVQVHSFTFLCPTPFGVLDSSVKGAGKDVARESGTVQLAAQRLADDEPLILGSSISGAMRARAQWLWRREILRGNMCEARSDEDNPVAELFGTTGRRAIIEIRNLTVSKAKGEKITSLKVDRFTGAPVYGALFTTDSFTGTRLSFELVPVVRGKAMSEDAEALWKKLLLDIETNGLEIGHGVNRGFGWFRAEKTT